MLKKILHEPLFHFLFLGAVIFLIHGFIATDTFTKPDEIVVTQGKIENLVTTFGRTWQRPPTEEELQGLIRDYVREEVAYREGLKMGLDQDDTIIRRRLRQKLEFLSEDLVAQLQPTDQELEAFLKANADAYRVETTFSFRHVYLSREKRGKELRRDAVQILAEIQRNSDPAQFGDSSLIEPDFAHVTKADIERIFGEPFAATVAAIQPGQWQGPIESGYGLHLVQISERQEGRLASLGEVQEQVRRDWENEKRQESIEKFYTALIQRYMVRIESPQETKIAEAR